MRDRVLCTLDGSARHARIARRPHERGEQELVHADPVGREALREELARPTPLAAIVAGVAETARPELYRLAFTIVRADETVSGGERIYLAQLAHQLGLDATTMAQLETDTASKIDRQPDADKEQ